MADMRAKMKLKAVLANEYGEELQMEAVCGDESFGKDGASENNTYARFTPTANLTMSITNPDLHGKFKPGDEFYVDFTRA